VLSVTESVIGSQAETPCFDSDQCAGNGIETVLKSLALSLWNGHERKRRKVFHPLGSGGLKSQRKELAIVPELRKQVVR
jgi:hypothetical protein